MGKRIYVLERDHKHELNTMRICAHMIMNNAINTIDENIIPDQEDDFRCAHVYVLNIIDYLTDTTELRAIEQNTSRNIFSLNKLEHARLLAEEAGMDLALLRLEASDFTRDSM
jgi:hypothetical protein